MPTYYKLKAAAELVVILLTVISSWIVGARMRRRIRKDLGRRAQDSDLSSIETWMKVDAVEDVRNPGGNWISDSFDVLPDGDPVPEDQKPIELFPNQKDKSRND